MRKAMWFVGLAMIVSAALAPSYVFGQPSQSARMRNLAVTREADPRLPDHTIYRPTSLNHLGFKLPVIVWENGGCSESNASATAFLTRLAASGFLVIAKGAPTAAEGLPINPVDATSLLQGGPIEPERMVQSIDWAVAENNRPQSKYYRQLALNKIAASGYSCGGVTALNVAAMDSRVRSVLGYNTATDPKPIQSPARAALATLSAPTAWIEGGPTDIAYPGGESDWMAESTMPAFQAQHLTAGHSGFWQSDAFQVQMAMIGINWLDLTLNGNIEAQNYILGSPCGFCADIHWSTKAKNWQNFSSPDASASSRQVPVTREADPGLPTHTIYRPTDLKSLRFDLPIVVWENGSCSNTNAPQATFLTRLASSGFLVVAKGPVEGAAPSAPIPSVVNEVVNPNSVSSTDLMIMAINWVIAENQRPESQYFHRLDTGRIAASGYSCGGITSLAVAADDVRVRSVLGFNTATDPAPGPIEARAALSRLTVPTAWIQGGPTDIAYPGGESDWQAVSTMPAFQAQHLTAGHGGFWQSDAFQLQMAMIGINWLDLTLNGNIEAQHYILGTPCGFCSDPKWSAKSKNWDSFQFPD